MSLAREMNITFPAERRLSTYKFVLDFPLRGYRKSTIPVKTRKLVMRYGQPQNQVVRVNAREYTQFKNSVLALAMEQGFRQFTPTIDRPAWLSVVPYWTEGPRIDWKNVYGAVEDGLFPEDRCVIPGAFSDVKWGTGSPECAMVILQVQQK